MKGKLLCLIFIGTLLLASCGPAPVETVQQPEPQAPQVEDVPENVVENTPQKVEEPKPEKPVTLSFWSHWATEPSKQAVVNRAIEIFQDEHPNVRVDVTWWNKADMFPAMRNAFTAGKNFPDIFYWDRGALEFIDAGWLANLDTTIDWSEVQDSAKEGWHRPGPNGVDGIWAVALETSTDEIYYNVSIFRELGIEVPADFQFTQEEFYNACVKIRDAGYDCFANAVGANTSIMGHYLYAYVMLSKLGEEDFLALWKGEKSWKDPEVVEAINYVNSLIEVPAYPATYATMNLAEQHIYFHTQQKAAMFLVGSWYTGRAFAPPDKGGQPPDFELGMLRYPLIENGKGGDLKLYSVTGSMSVAEASPNKELALELLQIIASTEIGNMWVETTAGTTGMVTTEVGGAFTPYFEIYNKSHEGQKYLTATYGIIMSPEVIDAYHNVLCTALPLGQVSLDQAIDMMEEARLASK